MFVPRSGLILGLCLEHRAVCPAATFDILLEAVMHANNTTAPQGAVPLQVDGSQKKPN